MARSRVSHSIIAAFAVALIAMPAFAVAAGQARLTTITLGSKASGTIIRPHVGDRLVVKLAGNPTTGYEWKAAKVPAALHLDSSKYMQSPPKRVGEGGTYAFTFTVRAGSGKLQLVYRRSFETNTPPAKTFNLTIHAR